MATVWAAHVNAFKWKNDPAKTGWSHLFAFESLSDLVQQMFRLGPELPGQVTKLAIVAHGDRDGDVRLYRVLSPESATNFGPDFTRLDPFLVPNPPPDLLQLHLRRGCARIAAPQRHLRQIPSAPPRHRVRGVRWRGAGSWGSLRGRYQCGRSRR